MIPIDVLWIGGSPGAGKSTVTGLLAERYGWRTYHTDDVMGEHAGRSTPEECPLLHRFMAMSMDERWVDRTPETMLETFHWWQGEGFGFIMDDLRALPPGPPVVVEGHRLLPRLVAPLLTDPRHAVWLISSREFRRHEIPSRTSDPRRASDNLDKRDRMYADRLRTETAALGLTTLEVAEGSTPDDLVTRVEAAFGL